MRQDTQIIFINTGKSWFLPYVVHQARHASPHSRVLLLADRRLYKGIETELLAELESDDLSEFRNSYVHMSSNPKGFELFCWERWFYLRNYMRKRNVAAALYLDSDVLLYSSIDEITKSYGGIDWRCGMVVQESGPASAHVSYWTLEALEEFCRFALKSFTDPELLALYLEKWDRHIARKVPGGVCDMTTLYLFYQSRPELVFNMAQRRGGNVFDNNMNTGSNFLAGEYATIGGIKRTEFRDGRPFFFSLDPPEAVRAHALHFQGAAKRHIKSFYTGPSFPGKCSCDLANLYQLLAGKISKLIGS